MASLPVTSEYLISALQKESEVKDVTLRQHSLGDLVLPTGELVACDPFVVSEDVSPFNIALSPGKFPVTLSIAHIRTDQRVAFAAIRVAPAAPASWDMLTVGKQNTATLKEGEIFGYGVDSGTGCFMDVSTASALNQQAVEEQDYYEALMDEMEKTYVHTWSWLNQDFGRGNLLAFSSGFGDGFYATYAGRDANGQISAIVTDFAVLPSAERENPLPAGTSEQPTRKTARSFLSRFFGKS